MKNDVISGPCAATSSGTRALATQRSTSGEKIAQSAQSARAGPALASAAYQA
jgi:hypothetical protein